MFTQLARFCFLPLAAIITLLAASDARAGEQSDPPALHYAIITPDALYCEASSTEHYAALEFTSEAGLRSDFKDGLPSHIVFKSSRGDLHIEYFTEQELLYGDLHGGMVGHPFELPCRGTWTVSIVLVDRLGNSRTFNPAQYGGPSRIFQYSYPTRTLN